MILPHQVLDRDCSTGAEGEGRSESFFEPGQHLILNRGRNSHSESFFEGGSSITFKEIRTHHYRCQIFSVATPMAPYSACIWNWMYLFVVFRFCSNFICVSSHLCQCFAIILATEGCLPIFSFRDAWSAKFGWIFGKTPNVLWPPPALVSDIFVALLSGYTKICNNIFRIKVIPHPLPHFPENSEKKSACLEH